VAEFHELDVEITVCNENCPEVAAAAAAEEKEGQERQLQQPLETAL
jgi:hypothetical protein